MDEADRVIKEIEEQYFSEDNDDIHENYDIFHPSALVALILDSNKNFDILLAKRSLKINYLNSNAAVMTLVSEEYEETIDSYVLDILARVIAKESRDADTNEVLSCIFHYKRLDVTASWQIFPSAAAGFEELQTIDFIFGQFVYYDNHAKLNEAEKSLNENIPKLNQQRDTNIVAKGVEGTGHLVRVALKGTGTVTGMGIKQLGSLYTHASVTSRELFGKPIAARSPPQVSSSISSPSKSDLSKDTSMNVETNNINQNRNRNQNEDKNVENMSTSTANKVSDISMTIAMAVIIEKEEEGEEEEEEEEEEKNGMNCKYEESSISAGGISASSPLKSEVNSNNSNNNSINCHKQVTKQLVENAMKHRKRAETVHASARTVTGAALYPVRWTGKKAAEWASPGNTNIDVSSTGKISRSKIITNNSVTQAMSDTVGGLFNAVVSSFKGITEALGEVGSAISETAMNHATIIHGEEYSQQVTKQYVDAAGEIGLASYKLLNVAGFGVIGIAADAAVEGATFLTCLSDFLVGPIILQGYMDTVQYPLLTPKRYFVVMRPWSLAFYHQASDIYSRPSKIVITAMLDTLPKLRNYPIKNYDDRFNHSDSNSNSPSKDNNLNSDLPVTDEAKSIPDVKDNNRFIDRLRGGDLPHIEICTVDCSTYLIYPNYTNPNEALITNWYDELKAASKRVETVGKQKSGAEDIALERRLRLLPKPKVLVVTLKCCVFDALGSGIVVSAIQSNPELIEDLEAEVNDLGDMVDGNEVGYMIDVSPLADSFPTASAVPVDEDDNTNTNTNTNTSNSTNGSSISVQGHLENQTEDYSHDHFHDHSHDEITTNESQGISRGDTRLSGGASGTATATPTIKSVNGTFEAAPTMMGLSVSKVHNATMKSVRVRLVPLSDKGIYLRDDMYMSELTTVQKYKKPVNNTSTKNDDVMSRASTIDSAYGIYNSDEETCHRYLSTLYDDAGLTRLTTDGNKVTLFTNQTFTIGQNHSVTSGDIKYLTVTLQGKTIFGASMEIGKGRIQLADIMKAAEISSNATTTTNTTNTVAASTSAAKFSSFNRLQSYSHESDMWIPMIHDNTKQRMAYILVSAYLKDNDAESI